MSETTEKPPETTQKPTYLRHKRLGFFKLKRDCWGERYEPAPDPEGVEDIPQDFSLATNFSKVPSDQWSRVIYLYFKLCDPDNKVADGRSEVSVIFARKAPDFKEWRTFVPKQTVGAASVNAQLDDLVDIVTGEHLNGLPEGWCHAGSSHSHNTMGAFFSGTDDANELTVPGLHVVVGKLEDTAKSRLYVPLASIVSNRKRVIVPFQDVLDTSPRGLKPHENVYKQISKFSYSYGTSSSSKDLDDTDELHFPAYYRWMRERREKEEKEEAEKKARLLSYDEASPKFSKDIENDLQKKIDDGDLQAIRIKLAVSDARRAAKSLPDKEARTIHRLCDAVAASLNDKPTRDCIAELMQRTFWATGDMRDIRGDDFWAGL